MSKYDDKTAIGGENVQFPQTAWTMVQDPSLRDKMREELSGRYWKPIYFYLRRKGFGNERAKDLTQGFFAEVLLGRDLVQNADRTKGKLRTLLLTALDRYVASIQRSKKEPTSVKEPDQPPLEEIPDHIPHDPMEAFNFAWASTFLEGVLEELARDGKDVHWQVFRAKVLQPLLSGVATPSLAEICAEYGLESEAKASNMIATVKRRFQAILRRRVRQSMDCPGGAEGAFHDLMNIFSKNSARF